MGLGPPAMTRRWRRSRRPTSWYWWERATPWACAAWYTRPKTWKIADELSNEQLGALLAALDQGAATLALAGSKALSPELLQIGLLRLLNPAQGATAKSPTLLDEALHHPVIQERLLAAEKAWRDDHDG